MVRSFLAVGQGAFYSECFRAHPSNINVVYDCGSSTDKHIVENMIKNTFYQGEEIAALFISHLHDDHVNGIPFLLKHCKVKKIYFPLITPGNKIILSIQNDINDVQGFAADFLINPWQTIQDLQIDYRPELIGVREQGQEPDEREREYLPDQKDDVRIVDSGDNLFEDINFSSQIHEEWLYIPFNFRQKSRIKKLNDNLLIQFGRTITEDDLEQMWADTSQAGYGSRQKIKAAYQSVPGTLNVNSMTLFSGEKKYALMQYYGTPCVECCKSLWQCACTKPSGCLYTGDYDAAGKKKWEELETAYKEYWKSIGCIQVPHHGSKHNFNYNFLNMNAYFVVSAGFSNRYQHPHARVVKAFLLNRKELFVITEQTGSSLYFRIE